MRLRASTKLPVNDKFRARKVAAEQQFHLCVIGRSRSHPWWVMPGSVGSDRAESWANQLMKRQIRQ
jgi:hypothetical protein